MNLLHQNDQQYARPSRSFERADAEKNEINAERNDEWKYGWVNRKTKQKLIIYLCWFRYSRVSYSRSKCRAHRLKIFKSLFVRIVRNLADHRDRYKYQRSIATVLFRSNCGNWSESNRRCQFFEIADRIIRKTWCWDVRKNIVDCKKNTFANHRDERHSTFEICHRDVYWHSTCHWTIVRCCTYLQAHTRRRSVEKCIQIVTTFFVMAFSSRCIADEPYPQRW